MLSSNDHYVLSSSSQATLAVNASRLFQDAVPARRPTARELHARPSLNKSARAMMKHWPKKASRSQLVRRPA